MPLTAPEKDKCRYHLGYPATQTAAGLSFGMPQPIQTLFLVDAALNNLAEGSVENVRRLLAILDGCEAKIVKAQDRLAAEQLGDLKLRSTKVGESEPDALEREYARWGIRLANVLACPVYAYAPRFQDFVGAGAAMNVPVRH